LPLKTLPVVIVEQRASTILAEDADRIAIERIRHHCHLQDATHIADGSLCREEEIRAGGHSSWEITMLRPATPLDHAVLLVLHYLSKVPAPSSDTACE